MRESVHLLDSDDNSIITLYSNRSPRQKSAKTSPQPTSSPGSSTHHAKGDYSPRADKVCRMNHAPAVLDSLLGVLDLEDAAVGREGAAGVVVAGPRRAHDSLPADSLA